MRAEAINASEVLALFFVHIYINYCFQSVLKRVPSVFHFCKLAHVFEYRTVSH